MSKIHKGKTISKEQKEKIKKSSKGKINLGENNGMYRNGLPFSQEEKMENRLSNPKRKQIKCIELNVIYPSIRYASSQLKIDKGDLSKFLSGKKKIKNIKGLTFEYVKQ